MAPGADGSIYLGQGPRVDSFEAALAYHFGLPHRPVTVNSATSGLHLALLLAGVQRGDVVITTPMTCSATNTPLAHLGARIAWADVDPLTGNIDPAAVARLYHAHRIVGERVAAIVTVDWAGRPCDYRAIRKAAPGVLIVQDAAHRGPDALDLDDAGDFVAWSFQAIKYLTCGDGGALWCRDPDLDARARLLRWYGLDRTTGESFRCAQDIPEVGHKWHMNDVAAAIGLANLGAARDGLVNQGFHAAYYETTIENGAGVQRPPWDSRCAWWLYTVLVERREAFQAFLADRGIETSQVHRRNDLHTAFARLAGEDPAAVAGLRPGLDEFARRQVAIPVGWWLSEDDTARVAAAVKKFQEESNG